MSALSVPVVIVSALTEPICAAVIDAFRIKALSIKTPPGTAGSVAVAALACVTMKGITDADCHLPSATSTNASVPVSYTHLRAHET